MTDKIILYKSFYNPIEANIIRARLEDSGIPCFLVDENISTIQPLYNQAVGGVKLMVFEKDTLKIDSLLAENNDLVDNEDQFFTDKPVNDVKKKCEKCGSENVAFGQATKGRFSWWVTVISIMLLVYPFKVNKCFHCYDCGNEFQ
ncbi:hypothetical protein HDF26_004298 [Pedobacter cryoconitis]|uniref:DUF2007 domain-containing protein n=1 Tax=Pedobacter cryoconitis TaxID=188932 RepID=A0A7W8ZN41_9SPHI|nr:DUF2007 domain-containing protein [Pedobacter cryoconitis]MBB5637069.1 hypothetical protein [Pedobacter cryoconitis]MBB6273825.1 hypothetical protein [Pedobacter cryoconitis]